MTATLTGKRVRVRARVNLASRRATRSPRLRKNASNGFCRQREEVPVRRQPPSLPSESLSLSLPPFTTRYRFGTRVPEK